MIRRRSALVRRILIMLHGGRFRDGQHSPCCRGERLMNDPVLKDHVCCPAGGELYPLPE